MCEMWNLSNNRSVHSAEEKSEDGLDHKPGTIHPSQTSIAFLIISGTSKPLLHQTLTARPHVYSRRRDQDGDWNESFPFIISLNEQKLFGSHPAKSDSLMQMLAVRTIDEFLRLSMLSYVRHSFTSGCAAPAHAQLPLHIEILAGTLVNCRRDDESSMITVNRPYVYD